MYNKPKIIDDCFPIHRLFLASLDNFMQIQKRKAISFIDQCPAGISTINWMR